MTSVAIAGLGAIGLTLARRLAEGAVPGLVLAAVHSRDPHRAREAVAAFASPPFVAETPDILADRAEIVVEAAPAAAFAAIARPVAEAGGTLVACSAGALLRHFDLVGTAKARGGRIIVPTGAIGGLDAVRAAAEGTIREALIETRKAPEGWRGAPYLAEHGIALHGLDEPVVLFEGGVLEAARGFPANVNVAAALAMAGAGPEGTRVRLVADPTISRNVHRIEVDSDAVRFAMTIEGVPDPSNPRTSRLTAFSVLACLRGLSQTLRVGS